jgi:hypothetical protein
VISSTIWNVQLVAACLHCGLRFNPRTNESCPDCGFSYVLEQTPPPIDDLDDEDDEDERRGKSIVSGGIGPLNVRSFGGMYS